jgi:2-desacetyl-2-hydroxyethyl bacteriochlorophyllide A dehydrogenase
MRAVVIEAPGEIELRQIERWMPEPGEVVVRCQAAAICTVERQLVSGDRASYPAIGGHEVSGIVEHSTAPDSDLRIGDRVVLDGVRRCGHCYYCLHGEDHLCAELRKSRRPGGYVVIGGGFAEYTTIAAHQAVKIPDHVSFEEASLVEPFACCLHSVRKSGLRFGETAVIIGAGTMGAMHVLLAKMLGARVIATDPEDSRLAQVKELGADVVIDPTREDAIKKVHELTENRGADVVFITAGTLAAGEQGLAMAAQLGRVVLYASCRPAIRLPIDWNLVHYRELIVTGAAGKKAHDISDAIQLLNHSQVSLKPLISKVISLEELPAELRAASGGPWRVVVRH